MDFFEVILNRRSIRRYTDEPVPESVMRKALSAAILAPNSSNTQTWDFYWVRSTSQKSQLIEYCLNQSAARTAQELVVVVASPKAWQRSIPFLQDYVRSINAPKPVQLYYDRLIPLTYRWGIFNSLGFLRWILFNTIGLFKPITRRPCTKRDIQEVSIKSAALAAENFVLAISAQGYASCMMEGFDESRVKKLLKLRRSDRVVMVISVGKEAECGTWGPRFRLPENLVIHEI